jgi:hypothetical protein
MKCMGTKLPCIFFLTLKFETKNKRKPRSRDNVNGLHWTELGSGLF